MQKLALAAIAVIVTALTASAQQALKAMEAKTKACSLPGDTNFVQTDIIDQPLTRPVKIASGQVPVMVQSGMRVLVAHADGSPFANVKVETVAPDDWKGTTKTLADSMDYMVTSSPGVAPLAANGQAVHGFEIHGLERKKMEGGVLSIYEMFRESDHIVITAYLLNHDDPSPYKSMDDFFKLRDKFVDAYTACLAK